MTQQLLSIVQWLRNAETLVIEQIKKRIFSKDHLINLVRMVNEEVDSTMNSFQNGLNLIADTIEDVIVVWNT